MKETGWQAEQLQQLPSPCQVGFHQIAQQPESNWQGERMPQSCQHVMWHGFTRMAVSWPLTVLLLGDTLQFSPLTNQLDIAWHGMALQIDSSDGMAASRADAAAALCRAGPGSPVSRPPSSGLVQGCNKTLWLCMAHQHLPPWRPSLSGNSVRSEFS